MVLQVFVGWDPRENVAWEVCRHSIISRTDPRQVVVNPLIQSELRQSGVYTREPDARASTEFSLTRFLTPHLAGPVGYALFVDCDFLFLADVRGVLAEVDPSKAVSVVQHEYKPAESTKMDGCVQYAYPRKNWSSFMVFNLAHPAVRALTPDVVNTQTPAHLHRFGWLEDNQIGSLDKGWNYLEGWYPPHYGLLKAVHYTRGGPWFDRMNECDFADEWKSEYKAYSQINPLEFAL